MENRHLELSKRSNRLFELTKGNMQKYRDERKKLLIYTESKKINYDEWEEFIKSFENKILKCS